MDLFDDNNPYYKQALPMPNFEPIFRRVTTYNQTQNRNINWVFLQPISCILLHSEQYYIENGRDKVNESMLTVYNTPDSQREFDLLSDVKKFKATKISARNKKELKFPKEFDKVFEELDKEYQLEYHLQRGINPFLHQPNYVQPITVYGQFSNQKNLKSISGIIEKCYLPNIIRICCKFNEDEVQQNFKGRFNNVKIIQNLDKEETVQILYLKVNEQQNIGEQFWFFVSLIYKKLEDGGCFVFEMKNLADSAFTQFLYLFQKLFLIISLDHSDILTLSPKISCFGFQRKSAIDFLNKVIVKEAEIKNNNYNIFRIRQLTQDLKFEHYLVSFYKQYLMKISQQIKLIQHFEKGGEISYQEFIQECEKMKQKEKEKKKKYNQPNDQTHYQREPRHGKNQKTSSPLNKNMDFNIPGPLMEFESYKPMGMKDFVKKQKSPQKQMTKEERNKQELEKLINQGNQKKQTTKQIQQKTYEEQLGLSGKGRSYNTTAKDRKKKH